jgi:hypothetical protein
LRQQTYIGFALIGFRPVGSMGISPKYQAAPRDGGMGVLKYGFAVAACFVVGFGAHMYAPLIFKPRAAPAPVAEPQTVPDQPPAPAIAPQPARPVAAQKSFSTVETPTSGKTEMIQTTQGTLAALANCRTAIQSGKAYEGFRADDIASLAGRDVAKLTSADIREGCRRITDGEVAPKRRG